VDGIAVRRRLRAQGSKWPALSEACQIATACGSPKPRERARATRHYRAVGQGLRWQGRPRGCVRLIARGALWSRHRVCRKKRKQCAVVRSMGERIEVAPLPTRSVDPTATSRRARATKAWRAVSDDADIAAPLLSGRCRASFRGGPPRLPRNASAVGISQDDAVAQASRPCTVGERPTDPR